MDETPQSPQETVQEIAQETPANDVFRPPSINKAQILSGESYSYYSPLPSALVEDPNTECVLGIDEAGRGPVLGPMVYGVFYIPTTLETPLLAETHHFDDSKALTPAVRSNLMTKLCAAGSDLHSSCGFGITALSARSISAAMLKPAHTGVYNLNAQAQDATFGLIQGVLDRGVQLAHVYVDTIGRPEFYQKKLERQFPQLRFTVATKADSLFPCVSAASVVAKVTRDAALEVTWDEFVKRKVEAGEAIQVDEGAMGWGSGYPSDARCSAWLKMNMDPLFGWGSECRFSWGTAKTLLEEGQLTVDWAEDDDDEIKVSDYFEKKQEGDELAGWFGHRVGVDAF